MGVFTSVGCEGVSSPIGCEGTFTSVDCEGVVTSIDFTDVSASSIDLHVVGASGLSDVAGVTGDSSHPPHSSLPRRVASVFAGVAGTLDPVSDCALAAFFRLFWLSDRISGSASSASSSLRRRKEAVCFGL